MRIAFDLDDTLMPCGRGAAFPVDRPAPLCPLLRLWSCGGLRCGARELLRELQRQGHEIWIYTTSERSTAQLRALFLLQGIRLSGVVNCHRHEDLLRSGACPSCSKYPPAFGIDLLVDDAEGVALEGIEHGFEVLVVSPADPEWTRRVLNIVSA